MQIKFNSFTFNPCQGKMSLLEFKMICGRNAKIKCNPLTHLSSHLLMFQLFHPPYYLTIDGKYDKEMETHTSPGSYNTKFLHDSLNRIYETATEAKNLWRKFHSQIVVPIRVMYIYANAMPGASSSG